MMESIFSFVLSYFSIILLAKGKISKSISISLEQSDEIVYFFTCWYRKLRVDRKILGWLWTEVFATTLVTRWMDEWTELIFCMLIYGVKKSVLGMYMVKYGCDLLGPNTLKSAISQE